MGTPQIPSVDSDSKQFPDSVRARTAANLTDPATVEGAAMFNPSTGYVSWTGTTPGIVPVVKPAGDVRPGVWEMTHNSESGYLYHLLLGANVDHQSSALIALGVDNDGVGLLIPNKLKGRGIVGDQRPTTVGGAYWLHATNRSTAASLVRLEQQTDGGSNLLELLAFGTQTSGNLLYVGDPTGQAGRVSAADGSIEWRRNVVVQDPASGSGTSAVSVTSNNGVVAGSRQHTLHVKDGYEFYSPTGTAGTWWPFKIRAAGSHLLLQAAGGTSAVGTPGTLATLIDIVNGKMSFFGATPVAQAARVGALLDSTTGTPATTIGDVGTTFSQAGLNAIHASLIAKINALESRLSAAGGGIGVTA